MYRRMGCIIFAFFSLFLASIHMVDIGVIGEAFSANPPTVSISANPISVAPNRSSTLTWSSTNATSCSIDQGIGTVAASGTKKVTVPATTTYTITAIGSGGTATASVTVTMASRPKLTFSANPLYIQPGQSSTLTWSTTNATSCFADWIGRTVATSGTELVTPAKTGPYTIAATGPGGQVAASVTVTVVNPSVTLSANPATINLGDETMLSWSSAKSNTCVIDQGVGYVDPTGSITVSPTQTTAYTIRSTDPLGETAMATATVTVIPPPTITISANPTSIAAGQASTLTWSTTNATTCSIDQGIGTVPTGGTRSISPTQTTTYIITATGPAGTTTATVTVTLIPPPTMTISANPVTINPRQSSTLSWSTANATACSIDQGIGTVATRGTQTVFPTQTTTYTITATGPSGTTTAAVTVMVNTVSKIDITITSPADGASVTGSSVMVEGTVNNSFGNETGVTVNKMNIASLSNNAFAVNRIPLIAGANTITVTAIDTTGTTATKSITVNAAKAANYIRITAHPESSMAPMEVTLRINGSFSIANPAITPTGPGTVEQLTSDNPDEYKYRITTEGIYYFTAQVTGPDNNVYQDTVAVTVLSTQVDALLRGKWEGMKTALSNQDINGAILNFASDTQSSYSKLFTGLKSVLASYAAELYATQVNLISIENNKATYKILVTRDGTAFSFYLLFIQDYNGIWKIWKY